MLYTELAGLEVTLQDKNLILSSVAASQTNTVLCIAPIWEDDGSNIPPADEGVAPVYDALTITKGEDFMLSGLGQYVTSNPLARLWRQALDAGAAIVKVIRLHGVTLEDRYIGLHDILTILGDYDGYDILTVGGVFADDECFEDITDAADKLLAQRNKLLTAYDADLYVSYTARTATVSQTVTGSDVEGTIAITLNDDFVSSDTITVAGQTVTYYLTDIAKGADPLGVSLESSPTEVEQATAIAGMTFADFTVTSPGAGQVLFTQTVIGTGTIAAAVVVGTGTLAVNTATQPVYAVVTYVLPNDFVDVASVNPTEAGTFTEEDYNVLVDSDGHVYITIDLEGAEEYPASIVVAYNYVADPTTIDQIDLAKRLVRNSTTTISTSDIGVGQLVEAEVVDGVNIWVMDLTLLEDFENWTSGAFTIKDSNGEFVLSGSTWSISTVDEKITFYKNPANWTVIFPIGSFFDFASQVAAFVDDSNSKGKQVIATMGFSPVVSNTLRGIKDYVTAAPFMQYSKYMQIVGGAELVFQLNGTVYKDVWHGAYAGMIAALPSYQSPLNKPIPGVIKQDYQLSPMQSLTMTNKHIVVSRKRNNLVVASDAVTTADDDSDFVNLTTVRIVNDAVNLVREIADPYIGQPNTLEIRAALETAIKSGLEGMMKAGAITDFRFAVLTTLAEQLEGSVRIALELVPVFTIRRIRVSVAVRPSL